jgi:hypothetical protein
MHRNYYLYIFFALGFAVILFALVTFFWDSFFGLKEEERVVDLEIHRPRFFLKGGKTIVQYNRIFYNRSLSRVSLEKGRICLFGQDGTEQCNGGEVDYFMGPSSYLVQANNYLFLTKDVHEILVEYLGKNGKGETVDARILLKVEGMELKVKEGMPISFSPLP